MATGAERDAASLRIPPRRLLLEARRETATLDVLRNPAQPHRWLQHFVQPTSSACCHRERQRSQQVPGMHKECPRLPSMKIRGTEASSPRASGKVSMPTWRSRRFEKGGEGCATP